MPEPDRWKTTRRCSECLHKHNGDTNYLWAQNWGENEKGKKQIKLNCLECGFTDYTIWDGK